MRGDTLQRGIRPAEYEGHDGVSRTNRSEHKTSEPLNPVVGWSIALIVSLGLWWGVWQTIASLISVLR